MILVARSANFSECLVDHFALKTIDDVSPETWAMLSAMGDKYVAGNHDPEILAIDDFLVGLKETAYFTKIKHLFIPIFAKEEQLSANRGQYSSIYDIITASPAKVNYSIGVSYGVLKNTPYGLIGDNFTHDNQRPSILIDGLSQELERNNMHLGVFTRNVGAYSAATNIALLYAGAETASNNTPIINSAFSFFDTMSVRNSIAPAADVRFDGCKMMSHNASEGYTIFNLNNLPQEQISEGNLSALSGDYLKIGTLKECRNKVALSFITIGESLTPSEQDDYYSRIVNICEVLNAAD